MAYYTGTVNSFADLKAVIEGAAIDTDWTLIDGILSKNGTFIQLIADVAQGYPQLRINAGTGQSGGSLTGAPAAHAKLASNVFNPITWPLVFHIFTFAAEIYCVVNHDVSMYQVLGFGISNMDGIGGTGGWFFAPSQSNANNSDQFNGRLTFNVSTQSVSNGTYGGRSLPWFFNGATTSSMIHADLDSLGWKSGTMLGASSITCLLTGAPPVFNQSHLLLPAKCVLNRPSGGITVVLQHHHMRLMRIDNINPGDVISYGMDKWMCFPWAKKDTINRNGISVPPITAVSSGTFGFAVRYEGP